MTSVHSTRGIRERTRSVRYRTSSSGRLEAHRHGLRQSRSNCRVPAASARVAMSGGRARARRPADGDRLPRAGVTGRRAAVGVAAARRPPRPTAFEPGQRAPGSPAVRRRRRPLERPAGEPAVWFTRVGPSENVRGPVGDVEKCSPPTAGIAATGLAAPAVRRRRPRRALTSRLCLSVAEAKRRRPTGRPRQARRIDVGETADFAGDRELVGGTDGNAFNTARTSPVSEHKPGPRTGSCRGLGRGRTSTGTVVASGGRWTSVRAPLAIYAIASALSR